MKKVIEFILEAILLAFILSFTSCEGDGAVSPDMVGIWTFQSMTGEFENPDYPDEAAAEQMQLGMMSMFMQGTTVEIGKDGSFSFSTIMGISIAGSIKKQGDEYAVTIDEFMGMGEDLNPDGSVTGTVGGDELADAFADSGMITVEGKTMVWHMDYLQGPEADSYREQGFTKYILNWIFKK